MRPMAELSASPHWLATILRVYAAREHSGNTATWPGEGPAMIAASHRWLPCSVLGPEWGAAPEHQRNAGTHRPPAHRLPPSAPGPHGGGPLAADRRCSGATARPPCGRLSAVALRPPAPLASGYRRLCPPVAPPPSRPPTRLATPYGRLGRLRHSVLRLPSGCSGWAQGPPSAPQRAPSRPFCARASAGPPRTAPPASCPPSSLGRLAALGGLRAPLLPPGAWSGPGGRFFTAPRPQATGADTVRE